ncbi:MAG: phosphoglycolate phosphatase [Beijerinckiaceae bacterium]
MADRPTIVFDLDGTLADSARDLMKTLNVVLASQGLPAVPHERARDLLGAGARPLIERGFHLYGKALEGALLERLYQQFLDHYHAHLADETVLFPGALAAMDRLRNAGYRLAVCTNKLESHSRTLLDALGITDRFAAICGKDSFAHFKPDPRHLTDTIALAGGRPDRAIMVGDSRTDIDTAKAAGIPVIAVTFGYTNVPVSELGPDVVIEHFDALDEAVAQCLRLLPASKMNQAG